MGIAQGATPYLMITVVGHDLSDADAVVVSLRSRGGAVDIDTPRVTVTTDGEDSLLTVHLTQEETLTLTPSSAVVQARWRKNGEAHTTEAARIDVASCLFKGVI